jgi:AraC-like DNA-binding protein
MVEPWRKVRIWEVNFEVHHKMPSMPNPGEVVREVQSLPTYHLDGRTRGRLGGGQLSITVGGQGAFRYGKKVHSLKPGMAFLHRHNDPKTAYYYPAHATEPWHFLWISMGGVASERMISDVTDRYGHVFELPWEYGVIPRLQSFEKQHGGIRVLSPLEGAKLVTDVLAEVVEAVEGTRTMDTNSILVTKTQELIRKTTLDRKSLQDIADELEVSREHLSRVFKKVTGETPQQYQLKERMLLARRLLLNTRTSVKELGYRLGYDNACSFSRVFTGFCGVSPSTFRKSVRDQQE